jgi:hypothetical protein
MADKFGLVINQDYQTNTELKTSVFELIKSGQACGKLIVVNWRHHMIPNLSKKLGCKDCPSEYPQDSFDQVWQIKYVWDVDKTKIFHRNNADLAASSQMVRRKLTKKATKATKKDKKMMNKSSYKGPSWSVYSTITYQYFDPLTFSGLVGDYIANGTETGASWLVLQEDEGEM